MEILSSFGDQKFLVEIMENHDKVFIKSVMKLMVQFVVDKRRDFEDYFRYLRLLSQSLILNEVVNVLDELVKVNLDGLSILVVFYTFDYLSKSAEFVCFG